MKLRKKIIESERSRKNVPENLEIILNFKKIRKKNSNEKYGGEKLSSV